MLYTLGRRAEHRDAGGKRQVNFAGDQARHQSGTAANQNQLRVDAMLGKQSLLLRCPETEHAAARRRRADIDPHRRAAAASAATGEPSSNIRRNPSTSSLSTIHAGGSRRIICDKWRQFHVLHCPFRKREIDPIAVCFFRPAQPARFVAISFQSGRSGNRENSIDPVTEE